MLLKKNEKILFTGDSITDCSTSEQTTAYLGNSYVHITAANLYLDYPEYDLKIINKGKSGDTSRQLRQRWQQDIINNKPDILCILIGINDIWRFYDGGIENAVSKDEYIDNIKYFIESMIDKTKRIIVLSPFHLDVTKTEPIRKQTDEYVDALINLVGQYDIEFINLQNIFDDLLKKYNYSKLTYVTDKIHPTMFGHVVIAREVQKVLTK